MKLSTTMMMNETLLPTGKKAFTLAEVLITLSILGVVAALTIPSLVNRQSDLAAQVKLKKAISNYEDVASIFMTENETTDLSTMMGGAACPNASNYFKVVSQDGCTFTTADGAEWTFENSTGYAYVADSATSPRFGVTMWALNGQANGVGETDGTGNVPTNLFRPAQPTPLHGVFAPSGNHSFLNMKLSDVNTYRIQAGDASNTAMTLQAGTAVSTAGKKTLTPVITSNADPA